MVVGCRVNVGLLFSWECKCEVLRSWWWDVG